MQSGNVACAPTCYCHLVSCVIQVVCYQPQKWHLTSGGETVEDTPLVIGIMTDHMARQLAQNGHGAAVIMDTTFGLTKYMVSVLTGSICQTVKCITCLPASRVLLQQTLHHRRVAAGCHSCLVVRLIQQLH